MDDASLAYLPRNVAPEVLSISSLPIGVGLQQIAQLQSELATARREVRQLSRKSTAAPVQRDQAAVKQSLEREIDAASARRPLPPDGFAETQPSLEVTQYGSLLIQ